MSIRKILSQATRKRASKEINVRNNVYLSKVYHKNTFSITNRAKPTKHQPGFPAALQNMELFLAALFGTQLSL